MSEFDDRERAEEKKFELDQELEFKAQARRDKQLGLWAAGHLGLSGAAAEAYAMTLVAADLKHAGDDDVFAKVRADFAAKNVAVSDHMIRAQMTEMLNAARASLRAGG